MAGYLLLLADLVLVALLLTVAVYLCVGAIRLVVGRRRHHASADGRVEPVWRRCESCKHRWQGRPGDDLNPMVVRLRRTVRRAARKRQRTVEWARPQGWSRCPSCLSREVRDSRRQTAR